MNLRTNWFGNCSLLAIQPRKSKVNSWAMKLIWECSFIQNMKCENPKILMSNSKCSISTRSNFWKCWESISSNLNFNQCLFSSETKITKQFTHLLKEPLKKYRKTQCWKSINMSKQWQCFLWEDTEQLDTGIGLCPKQKLKNICKDPETFSSTK